MPPFTDRTWIWFAAICYLAAFILGTISVLRERRHSRAVMYFILLAGYALQSFGLYLRGRLVHGCPLGNTFEFYQFTAWSAITLYLLIGATFRLSLLGYFTSMLATALTVLSLATPAWDATRRSDVFGGNPWIELHAALALFSYGVFALLALTSIMFLLRNYSLKSKRLSGAFTFLPSIIALDTISLRLLTAGVVLMTTSLTLGAVYWLPHPQTADTTKLLFTVAVWLAYVVTLILRARGHLIAKRLAWTCIALFAAALLSLGPVNSSRHALPDTASTRTP